MEQKSNDKLAKFDHYFSCGSKIILDSKPGFKKHLEGKGCVCDTVPSGKHVSRKGNHINDLSQLHSELKEMNHHYRGISTRHLQDYLNFHCFLKKLCYSIEPRRRKIQAYLDVLESKIILKRDDICRLHMPIDLYEAYDDYHYGIYTDVA